jgi:hypothetical protein
VTSGNLKQPPNKHKAERALRFCGSSLCMMEALVTTLNHTLSKLR